MAAVIGDDGGQGSGQVYITRGWWEVPAPHPEWEAHGRQRRLLGGCCPGHPKRSEDPNVPMQCEQLTKSNNHLWAAKMKIIMLPLSVWSAVEGDVEFDEEKDQGLMAAISPSVPDDVMMAIVKYQTAREAWDVIRTMRIGEARVMEPHINRSWGSWTAY